MRSNRLAIAFISFATLSAAEVPVNDGYIPLYSSSGFEDWILLSRDRKPETANKVFSAGKNGEIHVYKEFPDGYQIEGKINDTHALMVTRKSYSRYSFKFDYKWGQKKLNNFNQYQYDAGCYFHMQNHNVWPESLEFQIRFDHIKNQNHTGDFWNCGVGFTWQQGPEDTFLAESRGGKVIPCKKGEHRAASDAVVHGLNDQWNECELIVMGDAFVIQKVNGKVVNYATQLAKASGPISLQAETAEIFYRNIKIKEFAEIHTATEFLQSTPQAP